MSTPVVPGKPPVTSEAAAQDRANEYRRVLSNAVTFVRSQEVLEAFAATTFEDAVRQQIAAIEGDAGTGRPNALERISRTASELKAVVAQVRDIDPSAFADHDPEKDVNTAV